MTDPIPTPAYRAASSGHDEFAPFLTRSAVVDYDHPAVAALAREFRRGTEIETARAAYEAVRDRYRHSHDIGATEVSVSASDVVRNGHGICFAKSHLLAAVLRGCGIPAGFCYQRLLFDDAEPGRTCLHGFNAVWLGYPGRWHRLDARGNKPGIDAVFDPGRERLAFRVRPDLGERDYPEIHAEPLLSVIEVLTGSGSVAELNNRLPPDLTMVEPHIRPATAADVSAIARIVEQAYRGYVARIGRPPGPMLDDYAARVAEGVVWLIEEGPSPAGIIVLLPRPDHLLLDNIAVAPGRQRGGLGRRLLAFAEEEAARCGYPEIRLYTHRTMTENQRLYAAIGYEETGRGTEAGYERVFMRKRLGGA